MSASVADLYGDLTMQAEGVLAEHHGDTTVGGIWREDPAQLRHFVTSPEHLGLGWFYPRQEAAVMALLGGDPKRIFEEPIAPQEHPLPWVAVKSSNVQRVAYAPGDSSLYVQFKPSGPEAGPVYRYIDVPPADYVELLDARSAGKWITAARKRYGYERVERAVEQLTHTVSADNARRFQLAVLLWGKGAGKDYICSVVVCYLLHILLCLRNPQAYLNQAPGEPIDVVNVAYNADQAKKVFFEKLKQRLHRWRWLRENYDIWEAGRRKHKDAAGRPQVQINDNEVLLPRGIRCFSKHAQNEGYEGLNVIAWLMDEASAFLTKTKEENAERIYQTLRTSAVSRFGLRWVGFIISYPRHADDFTCRKLRDAERDPELGAYADGPAATWDVNEGTARQQRVEVRPGHWVPVEFAADYLADFEEALGRYECKPPLAKDALIKDSQRVWDAVAKGRAPLIEWEPHVTRREGPDGQMRRFSAVKLTKLGRPAKGARLFFHGDPARSSDAFALCIGHGVPATVMTYVPAGEVLSARRLAREGLEPGTRIAWERDVVRTVIDAMIVWRPDPSKEQHVDLLNVADVLEEITSHYGRSVITAGTFDQYDSAETIQRLQAKKFNVENEAWSNPFQHRIYRGARSAFYNDLVTLPDTPTITSDDRQAPGAIYELVRVEEIDGHKIDHPQDGSKDLADALVRVIEHVQGQEQRRLAFGAAGAQPGHTGYSKPPGRATDPSRTPSPVTAAHRAQAERQMEERPPGVIDQATGEVIPDAPRGKLAFGSARTRLGR